MPLHEWKETFELNYSTGLYDLGTEHSPTTWIFEAGSFVPCGKIANGKHYSIITDHLGTPIEAYNQEGELIWEREQDLYGNSRQGFAKENFRCPFKYQGQYYDSEVELCYNRFRYYHPETGRYISEDPIGFLSGEPNFFAYVSDTNAWVDLLGLSYDKPIHHIASNKHKTYSSLFRFLFKRHGLGRFKNGRERKDVLNDPKNKVAVEGHKGPHGEDYHKEIYNRLEAAGARGEEKARKEGITEESKIIEQGAKEFIKELQKLSKECSTEGERFNKIITKKI